MSGSELIDRVGVSKIGFSDAIKSTVREVRKEKNVSWFQVLDQRGRITSDGEVEFQVIVRMGI